MGGGLHGRDPTGEPDPVLGSGVSCPVLAEHAGMPAGVCNVILGPSDETKADYTLEPRWCAS